MSSDASIRTSSQIRRRVFEGGVVFEKQYTTDDWGATHEVIRSRTAREQQLIEALQFSQLFGRRLGLVRLANCSPEEATISTYEIQGQTLGSWLREQPHKNGSLLPWFLAGKWLRQLQQLPLAQTATAQLSANDPVDVVEYCDLRLHSLRTYGYRWPDTSTHQSILQTLENLQIRKTQWEQQAVWVHADYAPGNLIWGDGILTPIDFAMARVGGPLEDATYLIHRLEMYRIYRPWWRLPVAAYRRAILRGLGRAGTENSSSYHIATIRNLICRLHTYVRRPPAHVRQSLHDQWVRGVIRKKLGRAIVKCMDFCQQSDSRASR